MNNRRTFLDESESLRFRATFGTTPNVCARVWQLLDPMETMPTGVSPKHLLMALMFLKLYCSETVHGLFAGVNRKTFRKWSWLFVEAIASLEHDVVSCVFICRLFTYN